jgi:cobalt-zinc-cadmium efflux system outer membrane protein
MTTRIVMSVLLATLAADLPAFAQAPGEAALAGKYMDPAGGLSLEQAIGRALEQEPSLRSTRSEIDVARGMRAQASLRPNPTISFERREEPDGTDSQTAIGVEWPLDLFRRRARVAVADREVTAVQLAVADRERLLASAVRTRYGDVLAAVRDLAAFDELVAATRRQHELLRSRVDEGATPPLERDLLDVELRRLESGRSLQAGRTEAALFELKRVLGMRADAVVSVRDTLEDLVLRESSASAPALDAARVLEERVDVREAAARVDVAEAKIDRALREGRFDVSLFANYMRMDAGFAQLGFTSDGGLERVRGLFHYVSAGATVTIPMLNRNQGNVAAARAERVGAEAAHDATRLAAGAQLAAARALDEHARQAVTAYSAGAQTLARRNLTVVGQSYELGRVTVFDVLAERRRYLDVERGYTEALRAAYEARTALDQALGSVR